MNNKMNKTFYLKCGYLQVISSKINYKTKNNYSDVEQQMLKRNVGTYNSRYIIELKYII